MERRPKGTGSLRKRGGIWYARYSVRGHSAEVSTGEADRDRAQAFLTAKQAEAEALDVAHAPADRLTVAQLCELVLADHDLRKTAYAANQRWMYQAHIRMGLGGIPARRLTPAHIRQYIADRRKAGAADASINRELALVRRGYSLAAHEGATIRAPYIPTLAEDNARQGFLTGDGYQRLLEALPERLRLLFVVGYHTGARKGELLKLRWEQVDFDAGLIRLEARQTKARTARVLPIWGDMATWLRWAQQEPSPKGWLFWHDGRRLGAALKGWREACEAAGMPGLLFHDLRRSAVRNMGIAGLGESEAMKITGHKTRAMWERYNISDEARVRDSGAKLDQFFAEQRKAKLRRA